MIAFLKRLFCRKSPTLYQRCLAVSIANTTSFGALH